MSRPQSAGEHEILLTPRQINSSFHDPGSESRIEGVIRHRHFKKTHTTTSYTLGTGTELLSIHNSSVSHLCVCTRPVLQLLLKTKLSSYWSHGLDLVFGRSLQCHQSESISPQPVANHFPRTSHPLNEVFQDFFLSLPSCVWVLYPCGSSRPSFTFPFDLFFSLKIRCSVLI